MGQQSNSSMIRELIHEYRKPRLALYAKNNHEENCRIASEVQKS
jgi:hypothetical protein